jgi:hypothetical protein
MNRRFTAHYFSALERSWPLLADFGAHSQPASMAASAETGAFLAALREVLAPAHVAETGSGFSSAVLPGALRAEDDGAHQRKVQDWLAVRGLDAGRFCGYDEFDRWDPQGVFLLFLDGDLRTREATVAWLQPRLARAVVVVHDAQPGTFAQVQRALERLREDPRGRLVDCSAWTRDHYGRSAQLWIGQEAGFPADVLEEIRAGPDGPASPPVRLLLCVNDTPENGRWECTVRCLTSLGITAQLDAHPLWIVDNGSTCPRTLRFLAAWCGDARARGAGVRLFRLPRNRYATYAFNRLLAAAPAGEYVVRIENDIEFHTVGWPRRMARFLARSGFGMACTKPVDLPSKAQGIPVSEVAGLRVQVADEVAGYCTAMAPAVRVSFGAFAAVGSYVEDVVTSARVRALGFRMAFLDPAEVCCYHVDRVASAAYQEWKMAAAREARPALAQALREWGSGARPAYAPFAIEADDGFAEVAV